MEEEKQNQQRPINLEIQVDPEMEGGQYVNMAVAQHSGSEFILDFIFIPPGQLKAKVKSRIILAPEHAKRLLYLMSDNVKKYEGRFGEIKLVEQGPRPMPAPRNIQ